MEQVRPHRFGRDRTRGVRDHFVVDRNDLGSQPSFDVELRLSERIQSDLDDLFRGGIPARLQQTLHTGGSVGGEINLQPMGGHPESLRQDAEA